MVGTIKNPSALDGLQVLQSAYNEVGAICTEGWVAGKVDREIIFTIGTTTVASDTQIFTYVEDGITLMVLHNIYTDGTRLSLIKTKRVA